MKKTSQLKCLCGLAAHGVDEPCCGIHPDHVIIRSIKPQPMQTDKPQPMQTDKPQPMKAGLRRGVFFDQTFDKTTEKAMLSLEVKIPEQRTRTVHQQRVDRFMVLAKQDVPTKPVVPSTEIRALRARLILEEALETIDALGCVVFAGDQIKQNPVTAKGLKGGLVSVNADHEPNLTEIVDGCCDIIVVTTGTLSACGVSDDGPQSLVDENNLAKFGPGHTIRADGKLIKPPNHKPPDIEAEIERQRSL